MNRIGTIESFKNFYSKFVDMRNVDIWLPPGYEPEGETRFPVIYMHDGRNLFDNTISYGGQGWEIDRAMLHLIEDRKTRGAIVVGIWNVGMIRWREYMPQKPYASAALAKYHPAYLAVIGDPPNSDFYLRFLIDELKPFIDSRYLTLPEQQNTFVMGSSMGGLISLYAISEYPEVFGGAGCVSTHWPVGGFELVDEMAHHLPDPANHKLYFDFGTETLDSEYEPYQRRMDECLRQAGYVENQSWITLKFKGAEHSESSWHERVHIPLEFLLG